MFARKLNEVLSSRNSFISDSLNLKSLSAALFVNIIHWIILIIKIKPTSAKILLHYNVVIGADFIDQAWMIYLIPITALLFLAVNTFMSVNLYKKEKLAAYFLMVSSVAVQLIFFVSSLVLVIANER